MEIIKSDKYEYTCYYYVDESIEGFEIVNQGIDTIREFLNEVDERTQIKDIPYRVVAYECDEINGFSIKQGGEYIMGISVKTFDELYKWFNMWFSCEKTYSVFGLDKQEKETYVQKAYEYSLRFLIAHEYYHVKNGHCDLPENEERFIFERSQEIEKENALFRQVLEYDADCCAMACCINHILYKHKINDELKNEMQIQLLSVYSIFKIFSEYEKYDFENFIEDDLLKYDHANAGLRFVVTEYVMSTIFNNIFDDKIVSDLCDDPVRNMIVFENEMLRIHNVKETLFGIAFTEKGDKHIVNLHNYWEHVSKKLEPYAHCGLAKFEPLSGGNVFINEKEDVAKCIEETSKSENVKNVENLMNSNEVLLP